MQNNSPTSIFPQQDTLEVPHMPTQHLTSSRKGKKQKQNETIFTQVLISPTEVSLTTPLEKTRRAPIKNVLRDKRWSMISARRSRLKECDLWSKKIVRIDVRTKYGTHKDEEREKTKIIIRDK